MRMNIKAEMAKIKADPKRYIGVLERAIERRNDRIRYLEKRVSEISAELSREAVVRKLKQIGWSKTKRGWKSPTSQRHAFQGLTLREAASLAALSSNEDLGGY